MRTPYRIVPKTDGADNSALMSRVASPGSVPQMKAWSSAAGVEVSFGVCKKANKRSWIRAKAIARRAVMDLPQDGEGEGGKVSMFES